MYRDDDLTLDQVRLAMQQIAREKKKRISAITINDVREHFKRGNNGTVGAFIKQVKTEHILAERYDMKGISPQLKAAITNEIDRFVKNADVCSEELINALEIGHKELCELNNNLTLEIANLNRTLEATKVEANSKEKDLTAELAAEKTRSENLSEERSKLTADLDLGHQKLSETERKLTDQSRHLGKLESSLSAAEKEASEHKKLSLSAQTLREDADKQAALAQQEAKMNKQTIDRLEEQNKKLDSIIERLEDKIRDLESQLSKLHKDLYETMKSNPKLAKSSSGRSAQKQD